VMASAMYVISGTAGCRVFDHGRHVDLGPLRGDRGSQNYPLPADLVGRSTTRGLPPIVAWT
jgi:hypothetical protein